MREWGEENPQEIPAIMRATVLLAIVFGVAGASSFLMEWCGFELADVGSLFIKLLPSLLGIIALVALVLIVGTLLLFKHHYDRD